VAGIGGVDMVRGGLYDNIRRQHEEVEEEIKIVRARKQNPQIL
jgi:hypothetical protein